MKTTTRRFRLDRIRVSLESVQADFERINDVIDNRREPLTEEHIANIISAYDYLNGLLDRSFALFSPAGLYSMLELNHIILCGTNPTKRTEYYHHIQETRTRFHTVIKDILNWYHRKGKDQEPFKKAARFYVKALSQPQLFLEGNHRTENIILNYLLVCDGELPFVISAENAVEYLNPSTMIKFSNKNSLVDKVANVPGFTKEFRQMLERNVSELYLS